MRKQEPNDLTALLNDGMHHGTFVRFGARVTAFGDTSGISIEYSGDDLILSPVGENEKFRRYQISSSEVNPTFRTVFSVSTDSEKKG